MLLSTLRQLSRSDIAEFTKNICTVFTEHLCMFTYKGSSKRQTIVKYPLLSVAAKVMPPRRTMDVRLNLMIQKEYYATVSPLCKEDVSLENFTNRRVAQEDRESGI